jgi:hypothetical protein
VKWHEYLRHIEAAEREHIRRGGDGMSPMEAFDPYWEDPQGRVPADPGYGTGGEVIELPARDEPQEPEPAVVVGDIFAALRELSARAVRGR